MKQYGFSKVYYSVDDDNITKEKVAFLSSNHKSNCQIKGDNVCNTLKFK